LAPEEIEGGRVVVRADRLTISSRGKGKSVASYKLDPTKRPKTIDLTDTERKDTRPGIYELSGDRLRLCWRLGEARARSERPTEFKPPPGSGILILLLEREK